MSFEKLVTLQREGQGSITYGSPAGAGPGALDVVAALNGLSTIPDGVGVAIVLGQEIGEVGNPAKLLDNREIPMFTNSIHLPLNDDAGNELVINDGLSFINFVSDVGELFAIYQPENYGTDYSPLGTANRFMSGYDIFPGVNPNPRPNVVGFFWAYNTTYQSGRVDPTEAAFRYATETYFNIGTDPYFEFHTPEITTEGGTIFRLDSTYVDRVTGIGFREIVMNDVSFYDTTNNPDAGQFYGDIQYNPTGDATLVRFLSQRTGGTVEIQLNNWTDFADGPFSLTWQGGITQMTSGEEINITSPRNSMVASAENVLVGQTVIGFDPLGNPNADSILDLQTANFGFRPPSMTTAEKNAIVPIGPGLLVFDSDLGKLSLFGNALTWETVTSV